MQSLTGIGGVKAVIQEIQGECLNHVAGEYIGEQFAKVVEAGVTKLRSRYGNLTEQQATALVSLTVAAGLIAKDGSAAIRNVSNAIAGSRLTPKLQLQTAVVPSNLLHSFDADGNNINRGNIVFHKEGKDVGSGKPTKVLNKTTYSVVELEKRFKCYTEKLPEGYKFVRVAKGDNTNGLVFKHGEHSEITLKMAKPDAEYPAQKIDYASYRKYGSQYIAKNGDTLYESKGNIVRKDFYTGEPTVLPKEEMLRLGIDKARRHPDAHIPLEELINVIKKVEGKK